MRRVLTAARNRVRTMRSRRGGDAGFTLIDLMVSMSIMSIVMALFTGGIVQMYRAVNRSNSVSTAQAQVHIAFARLDKDIRYASGISTEGVVSSDPYIEYLTTNSGVSVCTELRLHLPTKQLQRRTWTQGSSPVTPTAWIPLASKVTSARPFTFSPADSTFTSQRLRLNLSAKSGAGKTAASRQFDVTFTAMNTSLATSSDTVCTEGRDVP